MSFVKIWIHAVFATKQRLPFFTKNIKWEVIKHIKENAKQKNIFIDTINGNKEHLHCLISLTGDQNISSVMQLIKGEKFVLDK